MSKLGLVWVSRLDALFSKVYQALLLGRFYAPFPEDLNLGRPHLPCRCHFSVKVQIIGSLLKWSLDSPCFDRGGNGAGSPSVERLT